MKRKHPNPCDGVLSFEVQRSNGFINICVYTICVNICMGVIDIRHPLWGGELGGRGVGVMQKIDVMEH